MAQTKMSLTTSIIICTTIAAIFALAAAILQIRKQISDANISAQIAQKNENSQKEISDLQRRLLHHSDSIIKGQKTIVDLQNELAKKNQVIEELQNRTLDNVTGGDNFPRVEFTTCRCLLGVVINDNKTLPIRNVSIFIREMRMDYFVDNENGSKSTNSPEAIKEYNFRIGDISKDTRTMFVNEKYGVQYKEVQYSYYVNWLNGHYSGVFTLKDDGHACKVIDNRIISYTGGLNLERVVKTNNDYSKIIPLQN